MSAVLFGHAACLIPQDDPILDPLPTRRNRPPRILENQVQPPRTYPAQTIFNGPNCPPLLTFQIVVADPDIDDVLSVRWFVDYDPVNNPSPFGPEQLIPPDGKEQRDTRGELNITVATPPFSTGGLHLVEAVVSDSRLINREPLPRELDPDSGVVINEGYVDSFAWYVNFESQACP